MSPAPRCGAPTLKLAPCRRRSYDIPCYQHRGRTWVFETGPHTIRWQQSAGSILDSEAGRHPTSEVLEHGDCHSLAVLALRLEKLDRFEDGQSIEGTTQDFPEVIANFATNIAVQAVKHVTGIDSIGHIVATLRIAGILHCAVNGSLDACECLADLRRQALHQTLPDSMKELVDELPE